MGIKNYDALKMVITSDEIESTINNLRN